MTTQPITIENGRVTIRPIANGVWLTQSQIADLFGVFTAAETETSSRNTTSKWLQHWHSA